MNQPQHILCPSCHSPDFPGAAFCSVCGFDMTLNNAGPSYYLTRTIKTGGQGAIYEGVDALGNVYAIKEMLDNFATPDERREGIARFEAEAEMLQRLSHPRIPKVYTHFKDEGRNYLVMDFVRGEDLESLVERQGALPEAQVLAWADQICDVLSYLHNQQPPIIFRDLKPSNIMVQPDNTIKLIDFGIAKVFQSTQRGTQIGTPGYAPPEQYQGIATPASDVFALCATLHHLLTGRDPRDNPPFTFPPARDVQPSVSQRVSDVLKQGLQMRPEDRFRSIAALRAALLPPQPKAQPATKPAVPQPKAQPAAKPAATPQARPRPQAQPAAPVSVQARPAAQPALRQAPATATAAPRRRIRGCILIGAALLVAVIALVMQLPGGFSSLFSAGTTTPQTLISQPYTAEGLEIIVPANTSTTQLREAFGEAFKQKAVEQFGEGTQVQSDTIAYVGGVPQRGVQDSNGVHYRANVQGTILVPQRDVTR